MYNPLVSIIIPVYNGSKYLEEAVKSALAQTYKNIEIIIINDGSKDTKETEKIVKKYQNKVTYFYKENGGVSSALNLGITNMNGEWFSWLSHDDYYYPNKIERQIELLNTIPENELERTIVFSDFDFIDGNGAPLKIPTKNQLVSGMTNEELILSNIKRNSMGGCTFIISKAAYDAIGGFNEEIRGVSDFDYWYRLLFNDYKFHYINEILVSNRMHREQITYKQSKKNIKESKEFHRTVVENLRNSKYNKLDNFLKIGYYMDRRGIKEIPLLAYKYAKEIDNSLVVNIKICLIRFYSEIFNFVKSTLKLLYVKFVINKKA